MRLPVTVIACALACLPCRLWADNTLVSYNFDQDVLESGPDTYQIFRHKGSSAEISEAFASTGYASAHFTDQAHDGNFVEFQGYFPEQKSGIVHFSISFLIVDPSTTLNMALVGKDGYTMSAAGFHFWLLYQEGWLRHMSDGIPKKLFMPNTLEWYRLDVTLDLDHSAYDLQVRNEAGQSMANLKAQAFPPGPSPTHSLKEFSIVGDVDDRATADFYIDDLLITADHEVTPKPFVAPGRRQFFVEQWNDYHDRVQGKLRCLPARDLSDFGIDVDAFSRLTDAGQLDNLLALTRPDANPRLIKGWENTPELIAIVDWINGCSALDNGKMKTARDLLWRASNTMPHAYIYQLDSLIAQGTQKGSYQNLASQLWSLPQARNDIRNNIALAMLAFHSGDKASAGQAITDSALEGLSRLAPQDRQALKVVGIKPVDGDYIQSLKRYMPEHWETSMQWLVAIEQHYYALLWQGDATDAYALASTMVETLQLASIKPGIWLEREGDAAFFMGNTASALEHYQAMGKPETLPVSVMLKMADAYHLLGNATEEKSLREHIYRNFTRAR